MHHRATLLVSLAIGATLCHGSRADFFGMGENVFAIEFVTIGDPGNLADTTGVPNPAGLVDYTYRIGKFEISESIIDKANAESAAAGEPLGITTTNLGPNKPAGLINWGEAAAFVNWLNTSSSSTVAYKFTDEGSLEHWAPEDAGYDPTNLFRNSLAKYFLPSANEWYKAAYYDPASGIYYDYPTGSDTAPTPVASGSAPGTAVFSQPFFNGPADVQLAGGLSPYGTMAQGGNVNEWEETRGTVVNPDPTSLFAGLRGGDWASSSGALLSSLDFGPTAPGLGGSNVGFRVASRVAAPGLHGDHNGDNMVDAADYVLWRKNDGTPEGYDAWRANFGATAGSASESPSSFGAVPEPGTFVVAALTIMGLWYRRTRPT